MEEPKDFALYNGVSNRSRGWKSRKPGETAEPPAARHAGIKRWDGKSKTSAAWDGLRRDPELWFRNGNCFVHLYARGQSRRGPAFKLPFSTLLAAQCHPMVERFIARDLPAAANVTSFSNVDVPQPLATLDYWSRAHLLGRVDLYIPPPPDADKDQVYSYYLAIRNLFAWIFRRAVVGEHLGSALAGLFSAMREFRQPLVDNTQDLMCYLEDEGYLAVARHPEYALALLHLAETMHIRDLYIDAFAHCVGMYNDLFMGTEHQYVSAVSRKFIRRARLDMDLRLGSAGSMLRNLFEDELSETHLGLSAQSRAHLDRFRAFILGYYTTRLGYYPPISIDARSTIFEPHIYRLLADDFHALYDYLVDTSFRAGSTESPLSQAGFCVLQTIQAFDARHKFPQQPHPLPLLPDTAASPAATCPPTPTSSSSSSSPSSSAPPPANGLLGVPTPKRSLSSRRMSWFGSKKVDKLLLSRAEKLKPDTRLVANASLLKATNGAAPARLQDSAARSTFLAAYRQFEEDSVFKPYKADRVEKISLVEARKVRWVLVYAIHQTLQHCFLPPPPHVSSADPAAVPYHLSISPKYIPEWTAAGVPGSGLEPSSASSAFGSPPVSPTSAALPASLRTLTNSFTFPAADNMVPEPLTPTGRNKMPAPHTSTGGDAALPERCLSMTALPDGHRLDSMLMMPSRGATASPVFDIRPDIDYLGLANRAEPSALDGEVEVVMLPRSRSLTRTLSQKAAFRRSLSLFRGNSSYSSHSSAQEPASPTHTHTHTRSGKAKQQPDAGAASRPGSSSLQNSFRAKRNSLLMRPSSQARAEDRESRDGKEAKASSPYHEIVVHGYGNGTNPVQLTVTTNMADQQRPQTRDAAQTAQAAQTIQTQQTAQKTDAKERADEAASVASPLTPLDDSVTTPSTARSLSTSSTTSNTSAATADTALTALTEVSHVGSFVCAAHIDSPAADAAAANPGLSRSSSMYSSTAVSRTSSFVAVEAPAIPPRARPCLSQGQGPSQALPPAVALSISRSSSVYSTASTMLDDVLAAASGGARPATTSMSSPSLGSSRRTPPPPPLPARSSARHRRFSVYGGGDEYARVDGSVDALNSLGAATPQRSSSSARFITMLPESKRHSQIKNKNKNNSKQDQATPNVLRKPPPPLQIQTQQLQTMQHGGGGGLRVAAGLSPHRPQSMYAGGHATAAGAQRFDMVQEALEAVRETMEQHQMLGGGASASAAAAAAVSRTPSFVGVAALRSVNEDDELAMAPPAAGAVGAVGTRRRSKTLTQARSNARYRHSSYIGPRDSDAGADYDNDDDDVYMDLSRRGQGRDEHPEWDKFASLGGHTLV